MTSNIEKLIYKMLTENTGTHMLDSGGDSGRAWQRNIKRTLADFKAEPPVTHDATNVTASNEIEFSVSTFHYLTSGILELDDLCLKFNRKFATMPDWNSDIYGVSEKAQEWLERQLPEHTHDDSWNSYNGEYNLDQVLQGTNLTTGSSYEYPEYILLQIHNGADVRGGYTDAKLFRVADGEYFDAAGTDVYGDIDSTPVDTSYDGRSLLDESGNPVPVKPDSAIALFIREY